MSAYRWYLTAAAVRQYMLLRGDRGSDESPDFYAAEADLAAACAAARLVADAGARGSPYQTWRVKWTLRGRRTRLELTVSTRPRPEGPLPQLIAVRDKGP